MAKHNTFLKNWQQEKAGDLSPAFSYGRSVAAAAKNDQRNDDDPAAVVITKQVAHTVVIHTKSSFKPSGSNLSPSLSLYVREGDWCRLLSDFYEIFGAACEIMDLSVGGDRDHILNAAAVLALDINARLHRNNMPWQKQLALF